MVASFPSVTITRASVAPPFAATYPSLGWRFTVGIPFQTGQPEGTEGICVEFLCPANGECEGWGLEVDYWRAGVAGTASRDRGGNGLDVSHYYHTTTMVSCQCEPLEVVFDVTGWNGTVRVVVTE